MLKAKILIPVAAVVLAAIGGGAYAATQSGGDDDQEKAVLNDAAHRLNVSPSQLTQAFKAAMIDQIDAAVKAGKLSQAQANYLKQRIQHAPGIPFGGLGFRHRGLHGPRFLLSGAGSYLGLSQDKLDQQLESGQSLAQIANSQHKSVSGLEQAITADAKSKLDKAVAAGQMTTNQEQQRLDRLDQMLPSIVNGTRPPGPPRLHGLPGVPRLHGLPGGAGNEPPDAPDGGPPLPPAA
jgi:hypothetical protein